jgi:AraC-like DNA-binding protein
VTAAQNVALFRLLINRLGDECLGFLSRPLKRGSFALVARSAISATSLGSAVRRAARTFQLLQDDVMVVPVREGALAGLALRFSNPVISQQVFLHELMVRVIWRLLAWLVGGQLPIARFDFAFQMPPRADIYDKVFPAPRYFGREQSAFWFDATWLQQPVRRNEAALRTFLADAEAHVIVPWRGDDVVSARVRSYLHRTQPVWPDLVATADALHMAASTLQRRLANEGTAFQSLKDELRRDIAIVRLNTSTVPLVALAQELGFTDCAVFQRAFKRWTGSAPGTYRRGRA